MVVLTQWRISRKSALGLFMLPVIAQGNFETFETLIFFIKPSALNIINIMMRTTLLFLLPALHLASATYFNYDASLSGSNKCALVNVVIDESGTSNGDRTWMKSVAVPEVSRLLKEEGFHNIFACINEYGSTNNLGCTEADGSGNVNTGALETWENQATAANGWQMIQEAIQDLPSVINEKDLVQTCGVFVKTMYFMTDMVCSRS